MRLVVPACAAAEQQRAFCAPMRGYRETLGRGDTLLTRGYNSANSANVNNRVIVVSTEARVFAYFSGSCFVR